MIMTEIYVVHSHMHDYHGNGGGGFDWFPAETAEAAADAYRAETALADQHSLLEVQLFLTERPEGLTDEELNEWVFTKYEMGSDDLPVETPIAHFMKGSWDAEEDDD
jgi:hypothetical protein